MLEKIKLAGSTAIYDAIIKTAQLIDPKKIGRRHIEFFLLTDGEDNSSSASLDDAKDLLANSGISTYHMSLMSVGVEHSGRAKLDALAAGLPNVVHMAADDTATAIRSVYHMVHTAMFRRVEVTTVTTTTSKKPAKKTGGGKAKRR